ncbi:sulfite exporter TauE/SafE family protein [Pseudooceanicola sp. HF7]|uniref:sulfite exporter TauE/SafE family protein n=1 Tax=Pseudooceanicola sp. HF7 TaxID=2721560 RepID=UPI0014309CDD|nr:sulfite exporter TauE/SafE family protein [Pseudooceanicola sp. HF7]NIZ08623.1 sulfite exporter TauE/SafE family protein [Pseudooceanicola sp. HF7]
MIYLPVAEVSANAWLLIGLGALVGFMSGMFGVGGGFLLTPLLFFVGIPPAVAVATQSNQIVASSFSGALAHFKRRTLDLKMGAVLTVGGLAGSLLGVQVFAWLSSLGQIDLAVQLFYVVFLGGIGAMMFVESARSLMRRAPASPRRRRSLAQRMPLRMRFRTSGLYISVLPPLAVGMLCGVLAAIMGVGGGFLMLPAMIYLLQMPTKVVIGTSLLQITVVAGFTTILQARTNGSVDIVLALLLLLGGVLGAQLGAVVGAKLRGEQLRILLSIIVLVVAAKVALDLVTPPGDPFSLEIDLTR